MKSFASVRLAVLSAITVLSTIVLGLAADLDGTHGILDYGDIFGDTIDGVIPADTPAFRVLSKDAAGLAIAISVITLLVSVPLLVFNRLEKRSDWQKFLSLVWVEIFWATALWILWLVTAVKVEIFNFSSLADSSILAGTDETLHCGSGACAEASALKGLAWLTWFIMFGYLAALGTCSAISVRRGTGSFTHMEVDQVLSPNDKTPVGPRVVEEGKA